MARSFVQLTALALASGLAACAAETAQGDGDDQDGWSLPMNSKGEFESLVYPVLLRDCGFHTCHGSDQRFFRVWGPGRVRLEEFSAALDPRTSNEVTSSYYNALSFIDPADPERSLLLRKPLATEAGGSGHLGADKFGRNVYRTTDSQGYVALSRWAFMLINDKK